MSSLREIILGHCGATKMAPKQGSLVVVVREGWFKTETKDKMTIFLKEGSRGIVVEYMGETRGIFHNEMVPQYKVLVGTDMVYIPAYSIELEKN